MTTPRTDYMSSEATPCRGIKHLCPIAIVIATISIKTGPNVGNPFAQSRWFAQAERLDTLIKKRKGYMI